MIQCLEDKPILDTISRRLNFFKLGIESPNFSIFILRWETISKGDNLPLIWEIEISTENQYCMISTQAKIKAEIRDTKVLKCLHYAKFKRLHDPPLHKKLWRRGPGVYYYCPTRAKKYYNICLAKRKTNLSNFMKYSRHEAMSLM